MDVQSVLVEYQHKNNETIANSGTLINNKFIIITSSICIPILDENDAIKNIRNIMPGLQDPKYVIKNNNYTFNIVMGQNIYSKNLNKSTKFKETTICRKAKIKTLFWCPNIRQSTKKYFKDWINSEDLPLSEFLSLFFVLEFVECKADFIELEESLLTLYEYARNGGNYLIGDKISVQSAAFGNRYFINTYCEGIISNVVGTNDCLILTDCASVPGSEGSPIYYKSSTNNCQPLGILISTLNWWNGEWFGLSLATSWSSLLPQLIHKNLNEISYIEPTIKLQTSKLLDTAYHSLVQIVSGPVWGTGVLLQKCNGIFLTNSHVIEYDDLPIDIYWKDIKLQAEIVYKNDLNENYDLAVLKCLPQYLDILKASAMLDIEVFTDDIKIGDTAFAVGYPLFAAGLKPLPSIMFGNISQVHKNMLTTTSSVFPGCSGGAILNENGLLIAVIVSNIKTTDTGQAFPKVNCTIPVCAFWDIIENYLKFKDTNILKMLKIEKKQAYYWNMFSSKL